MKPIRLRVHIDLSRRTVKAILAVLIVGLPLWINSESFKMSTVYPSPAGIYQRMTTTGDTLLARDGGGVGVGVTAVNSRFDVGGAMRLVPQAAAPPSPEEGAMYYDEPSGKIRVYAEGEWKNISMGASTTLLGQRTLNAEFALTGSFRTIGPLSIRTRTPQKGLYAISWGGQVFNTGGITPGGKFRLLVGGSAAWGGSFESGDDFSGSTLMMLNRNVDYNIRVQGRRTAGGPVVVPAGASLRAELVVGL